ncbi:hypothetical protein EX30DRAFT_342736 [Ascodesmis nigricans]|uniref:PLD phosphodiesterase domain-containing protein n=1 Tax=Ascodesmis nigricans TaxID=341454 RepID=A0A4S2MPT1_9PEZI|nr:hypothetical protein EX30DRAFT_342736 [Ascodesmis nigricans]
MATVPTSHSYSSLTDTLLTNFSSSLPHPLTPSQHQLLTNYLSNLDHSTTVVPLPSLLTTSHPQSFEISNGLCVTKSITSAFDSAEHEILFVTCFWAKSRSLNLLSSALRQLSQKRLAENKKPIRVRICFSSRSLTQKLFHTASPRGHVCPPSTWASQLGLPPPEDLIGLDLTVKSLFFLPFSILHSKFTIIDRTTLFLPSANISHEIWLEQLSVFTGALVSSFVTFWARIWASSPTDLPPLPPPSQPATPRTQRLLLPTLLLPQPHHRNPRFWFSAPRKTPQNMFLLSLLDNAAESAFILSPNFTCKPVMRAIVRALERGVNVDIVTARRMMLVEQIVTTGGTDWTEFMLWRLRRKVRALRIPGRLRVWYYTGAEEGWGVSGDGDENTEGDNEAADNGHVDTATIENTPEYQWELIGTHRIAVLTHVKAVVVDREWTVLGSANVDRASWWTSQECSVAVLGREWAERVEYGLRGVLKGRVEYVPVGAEGAEEVDVVGRREEV